MSLVINTVKLTKYSDVVEEIVAGGTIYPGMLLIRNSSNKVVAHNDDAPASCAPLFAYEDALQGKGIDDPYVNLDPVQVWKPWRGDRVYAILDDGEKVVIGDFLESAGNGHLQKSASGAAIAVALEAVDLSGSSGEESSVAPFAFSKRIKVEII